MRDITIWNNDICEMAEALRADDPELYSDMDDLYDIAADMVDANLEDECCNLDIDMPHNLILTGTLQRWDGPRSAYKLLQTNNIGQALSQMPGLFDGDNSIIVKLEDNEVVLLQTGHRQIVICR